MEGNQGPVVDPAAASLHILLVDANIKSRQSIEALLNSCNYQVTACKTGQEAIQVLKAQQGPGGVANFDLILKEHCPSLGTNATRFLRRAQTEPCMQGIPVIVASAVEDRDVMVNCLQLGAADFMLKPLRASDLRNLWARVYWWRRATWHHPGALNSHPPSMNDSRSGSGSHETQGASTEPQEAALDEGGSRGASIPTATDNGTGDTGPQSKDLLGWSGTRITGSNSLAQQCSNPSSAPSQGLTMPEPSKPFTSCNGGVGNPIKPQAQKVSQLSGDFPPLDLQGRISKPPFNQEPQRGTTAGASTNPGFRAYVATEPQPSLKRPMPDLSSREDPGSSGSDWTGSLEKADQNKRQAVMSSQDNPMSGLSALTQAWLQSQRSQSLTQRSQSVPTTTGAVRSQSLNPSQSLGDATGNAGEQGKGQSSSLPPGFPFCFVPGMMLPAFGMPPAFWNQSNGLKTGQNGAPVQINGQQSSGREQGSNQHAKQQAMHNQIMYHHNLLLQQYGMVPPYMQYSAFANAVNQTQQQESSIKNNAPAVLNANGAKRFKPQPGLPSSSSQMPASERSNTPTVNPGITAPRILPPSPSSGMQQAPPAGGESTQNTESRPNTGSNVQTDGFMLEPSRKQRRAEALHKYKQKRKNLNFTKTIRYESRKQLAQARPRVKGQFVRITSEDVNAVVDSLTPAQMIQVAEGTDVTDLLLKNACQNAEGSDPKAEDTKDVEISDDDETVTLNEEEDVSSLASKDCQKVPFNTGENGASPQKPSLLDKSRRNSSQSGSNSPETEAHHHGGHLLQACV